jgi:predicted Rossmann fold flavoprotein
LSTVGVIGAGPAGILAAIESARKGNTTLLFDSNPAIGRKLLVTGAGRCNLTNAAVSADRYACADREWLSTLLGHFGHEELLTHLHELGILTTSTMDGWFYPASFSAATVVDTLAATLELMKVDIILRTRIHSVEHAGGKFILKDARGKSYAVDRLVMASGGKALPDLGSTGDLFPLLARWGHTVIPLRPALAPLEADMRPYPVLSGVRLDARTSLFDGNKLLGQTIGNLIFTEWGLNGPAVMDLSHLVDPATNQYLRLELDLLFEHEEEFIDLLHRRAASPVPARVILGAVLPPKVPPVILALAGLNPEVRVDKLSQKEQSAIIKLMKALTFRISGARGFKYCQVSAGGVPVTEVNPLTMQSRVVPGLFLAGEVLDVVGPCGGFNLQFAFSSGVNAGRSV